MNIVGLWCLDVVPGIKSVLNPITVAKLLSALLVQQCLLLRNRVYAVMFRFEVADAIRQLLLSITMKVMQ